MEYCILIELSKTRVTFSAYTGGEGGFTSYGEAHRPLAVWFSGNSVIIGKDAKLEALKGTPNAFYNLFEKMKETGHFDYANETHDHNKLVLYTLRAGLKEFFTERLLNSQGALEDNIGHLPLVMMFGADMEKATCSVVMSQLRDNGFGNVRCANEDDYLLRSLPARYADYNAKLVLSSDGNTLFGDAYIEDKNVTSFKLPKAGIDPRVEKLTDLIWERTSAENDWLEYDKELAELQRVANAFIASGEATFDGNVTLSNGISYHYYLSHSDLQLFNHQDRPEVLQLLNSHISNFTDRRKCCIVIKGLAATNKYLQEILNPEFAALVLERKDLRKASLALLLKECRAAGFRFDPSGEVAKPNSTKDRNQRSQSPDNSSPSINDALPTKRDERDFKILKLSVETYRKNGSVAKIKTEVEAFRKQMHGKGIHAFDKELGYLLSPTPAPKPKTTRETPMPPTPQPPEMSPKTSEGENLMRSGKLKEARDWFRSRGQTDKANDCTTIIRWQRVVPIYKKDFLSTLQAHNREKARTRAKEIDEKIALYKKYGMDAAELKQLSADYKRIRP